MERRLILLLSMVLTIISHNGLLAQTATVKGRVLDKNNQPFIPSANIHIMGQPDGVTTNDSGYYQMNVRANKDIKISFSFIAYKPEVRTVNLKDGEVLILNVIISTPIVLDTIEILEKLHDYDGITRIKPKDIQLLPSPSGDLVGEIIKRMAGVTNSNEMSSQYSVRGGNFDENLVYVNGFQIRRPTLVRSGQQEGLSFVNSDLVEEINFSAGGFEARYGDKMSSVLDIKYKRPVEFEGSFRMGLLGGSVHLEDASENQKLKYLLGVRYKSNSYLLSSLDTKGTYNPSFFDVQLNLNYEVNKIWTLSYLGNYSANKYLMIPEDRETNYGTVFEAYRFTVYFDGQEVDRFNSHMNAFLVERNTKRIKQSLGASVSGSVEAETYDIMGQYWIDVLENDMGQDDFGEVAFNKGVGTFLNHARNMLQSLIFDANYRGETAKMFSWGIEYSHDKISDEISEWQMIDSAGYSMPHTTDSPGYTVSPTNYEKLEVYSLVKAENPDFQTNRLSGYFQKSWKWNYDTIGKDRVWLNLGMRLSYWDFNGEYLFSPRANIVFNPAKNKKVSYRVATGIYSQQPFYREMRYFDGSINNEIKSQKSAQVVAGADYIYKWWGRPFKFTAEAYYKYLWDLIPYQIDDVRIRYYAENNAIGYATGLDLKINGEFVKGAESWFSLSLMRTAEDIKDDFYYNYLNASGEVIISTTTDQVVVDSSIVYPGYIPRPTDRTVSFNLFFQDYLPQYPSFKVHLNMVFAIGLPYGMPGSERYTQTRRYPPYRRVDVGFSKELISKSTKFKSKNPLRKFSSMWISVEVFNLLQINNTISYLWVMDVDGNLNSVPNYLTPRRINIVLSAKF